MLFLLLLLLFGLVLLLLTMVHAKNGKIKRGWTQKERNTDRQRADEWKEENEERKKRRRQGLVRDEGNVHR